MSAMAGSISPLAQRQAALRERYRAHPGEARIRKRACTAWTDSDDAVHGSVLAGDGYGVAWAFGIDRAVGGDHDAPNPADMLCAALAACEHATIRMIADVLGVALERLDVEVTGTVDVRGCLAVDRQVPIGFSSLECQVDVAVAPGTDPRLCEKLRAGAEASCINLETLRGGVPVGLIWRSTFGPAMPHRSTITAATCPRPPTTPTSSGA
jgi:uncharacterized OsmC-like protein